MEVNGNDRNASWFNLVMKVADPCQTPTDTDVLLGRGRKNQQHAGNVQFLQRIDDYLVLYHGSARGEKHRIVSMVINWVEGRAGRFLKRDSGGAWVEASDKAVMIKVAQAFRHRMRLRQHEIVGASAAIQQQGSIEPVILEKVVTTDTNPIPADAQPTGTSLSVLFDDANRASPSKSNTLPRDGVYSLQQKPSSASSKWSQATDSGNNEPNWFKAVEALIDHSDSDILVSDEEILRAVGDWEIANGKA